jgi:hypothetical protein
VARVTLRFDDSKRAYGKPAVKEEKEIVDLPPVVIQLTGASGVNSERFDIRMNSLYAL